jgi:outer membrane murein-binding lipoprotein Lpp
MAARKAAPPAPSLLVVSLALSSMVLGSLLLAGCGGDAKPDASSSSTTASSTTTTALPTTSPTTDPTTDPNIPVAARAHTPAGAEAFVRYFFDQVNIAWTTPKPGLLPQLCKASSKSCKSFEDTAVQLKAAGNHYDGMPVTTQSVAALDAPGGRQSILYLGRQEKRNVVDSTGRVVSTDQQKTVRFEVALEWTPSGWTIFTIKGT